MTKTPSAPPVDRLEQLVRKARKFRQKGEPRKALQTLREACLLDDQCAWVWTLYGSYLTHFHHPTEAQKAYRHALWLRRMGGDELRQRSTQALLDRLTATSCAA